MDEKREFDRKTVTLKTIIKKTLVNGEQQTMEFLSNDLSYGGVFILSDNLELFELGEEVEITVCDKNLKNYEGKACVVRSATIFYKENEHTQSGYGLMFTNEDLKPE
jgi:hypothetical protein